MKKIILSTIFLATLTACQLDRKPNDGAVTDEVINTEVGLEQSLNGIYRRVGIGTGTAGYSMTLNIFRNGTFGGDEVSVSGNSSDGFFQYINYLRNAGNGRSNNAWNYGFPAVYAINTIIEKLPEGKSEKFDHMLGESYYLRALVNFTMLLEYSKPYSHGRDNLGIPLKTTTNDADRPLRSKVGESYDAVVKDLLKAEIMMASDTKSAKNNIRASQASAQALLSRIYLYMEQNDKAIEYADKVLNSGRYNLLSTDALPTYAQSVPTANSETIFAFKFDNDPKMYDPDNMLGSMYAVILDAGWGEIYAAEPYLDLIQRYPSDVRNKFIEPQEIITDGKKTPAVYWGYFNPKTSRYDYASYNATVDASGNYISFVMNGTTYPIIKENTNYGGPSYSRYYATINGSKQYLHLWNKMYDRNTMPQFYINKLSMQENIQHLYSPVISRLAELYLIKAEAYAKQGNTSLALQNVNTIRTRAAAPAFTSLPNGKSALDVVLEERWLEFAFEGHRKFDLLRNKRDIDRRFPGYHLNAERLAAKKEIIKYDDNDAVFYIPQREINLQPELQQNP